MRTILHVDLDAFYASVEVLDNPALAGKPVLVGGTGPRGVVAAASYEARRFGIHSAMPMARARRLCPQAVVLPPRFDAYQAKSAEVHAIFRSFTHLVEPIALDEAFLDVTGAGRLFGPAPRIGATIRTRIRAEVGLTASVGVATTKLVAKLASEAAKPDGMRVVEPGTELGFLHPQPVRSLWGVGPATEARLARFGLSTIGDLAAIPEESLIDALGRAHGHQLHELAWGRDERPVEPDRETKSISAEETFPKDVYDPETLRAEARRLAEGVAGRLAKHGLAGRTVTIKVRYPDFRTITRSLTGPEPTSAAGDIAAAAVELLSRAELHLGVRLLGVGVSNISTAPARQLTLDEAGADDGVKKAVEGIRARFGDDALGSVHPPGAQPPERRTPPPRRVDSLAAGVGRARRSPRRRRSSDHNTGSSNSWRNRINAAR
ncbi:MAG: DNA polymerase IV [Acidimicrobiia bacterium]